METWKQIETVSGWITSQSSISREMSCTLADRTASWKRVTLNQSFYGHYTVLSRFCHSLNFWFWYFLFYFEVSSTCHVLLSISSLCPSVTPSSSPPSLSVRPFCLSRVSCSRPCPCVSPDPRVRSSSSVPIYFIIRLSIKRVVASVKGLFVAIYVN